MAGNLACTGMTPRLKSVKGHAHPIPSAAYLPGSQRRQLRLHQYSRRCAHQPVDGVARQREGRQAARHGLRRQSQVRRMVRQRRRTLRRSEGAAMGSGDRYPVEPSCIRSRSPHDLEMACAQLYTFLQECQIVSMDFPSRWVALINQDFLEQKSWMCAQMLDASRLFEVFRKRALFGGARTRTRQRHRRAGTQGMAVGRSVSAGLGIDQPVARRDCCSRSIAKWPPSRRPMSIARSCATRCRTPRARPPTASASFATI